DDGGAGVAVAGLGVGPQPFRAVRGPVLEQSFFPGDFGTIGATPLRPVVGTSDRDGEQSGQEGGQRARVHPLPRRKRGGVVLWGRRRHDRAGADEAGRRVFSAGAVGRASIAPLLYGGGKA